MRLLDKYPALLLDMHGTFMFGHDRFDEAEDFHHTYRSIGGSALSLPEVTSFIRNCLEGLNQNSSDTARYDNFPSLAEGFRRYANPPDAELSLLMRVFSIHETGTVSDSCAQLLRRLAKTHRLALVSNIWSPKQLWLDEFERAGIHHIFKYKVFSSDCRSIKPSPSLFREALRGINAQPHESLFVGDSLRCDMEGARQVGLTTVWITSQAERPNCVDYVISRIEEIERLKL